MRPIVWTRSSCAIGGKAAVVLGKILLLLYYVCLLILVWAKKHTHVCVYKSTWCLVNCFRIHVFYNRTKTRN